MKYALAAMAVIIIMLLAIIAFYVSQDDDSDEFQFPTVSNECGPNCQTATGIAATNNAVSTEIMLTEAALTPAP